MSFLFLSSCSEHIYQLVSSTKARRFNFTTVFVDERDGDIEPNNELLPEGPPKIQHDGYVVYQTAVHYDYHLPSASVPWRYAAAPAAATTTINTQSIHRRRRMGDLTYAEKADMHYMYGRVKGNGRAALRMYHAQFPDRQILDHRILQRCAHSPERHVWGGPVPWSRFIEPRLLFMGTSEEFCLCDSTWLR
ncbi:transposable element Tc1 transposase [Trichonephila clavipes]|nr:transposable element Tc1 transposase [Trichonephila clavipes]